MKVHFISIGGSVMHQLAIALYHKGYTITGSDDEIFEPSRSALAACGLLPDKEGWNAASIDESLDAVLLGMHARGNNPELLRAQELGIPVYSFPEYIYQESLGKIRVVVGGSHGKTTTASMIMHVLKYAQQDFDYLVGARLPGFDQSVAITDAPVIICEGDEYPASAVERRPKFHFLKPHIAVLTGIAWDHINVFPTFENYLEQFRIFIDGIEQGGRLIYNNLDPALKQMVESHSRNDITTIPYSLPEHNIQRSITELIIEGQQKPLKVFGNHNLLNAHAAWHVCELLGVSAAVFVEAMTTFTGASRRLEIIATGTNATVFRDFAHAPSKVKATMEAVKQQFPNRPLVAVLELHTYSSLNEAFMPHYAGSLDPADDACVFYSPHAMEIKQMPSLPKSTILAGFQKPGLEICTELEALEHWLRQHRNNEANLLLMSSGSYDGMNLEKLANDWII